MANEQNLKPGGHKLTKEEQSKGGKKSGETRRLQSAMKKALDKKVINPDLIFLFNEFGIKKGDRNYAQAIACNLVDKAARGNLDAIALLRDSIGEKPKDEISVATVDAEAIEEVEQMINEVERMINDTETSY